MKARLNKGQLDDGQEGLFWLNTQPSRVTYVAEGENGLPEFIFAYPSDLPTTESEPELSAIPHEEEKGPGEIKLRYKLATVILISEEADNKFRDEHEDLIDEIETLYIEG